MCKMEFLKGFYYPLLLLSLSISLLSLSIIFIIFINSVKMKEDTVRSGNLWVLIFFNLKIILKKYFGYVWSISKLVLMLVELYNLFAAIMKIMNLVEDCSVIVTQLKILNSIILTLKFTAYLPFSVNIGQHYMYSSVDYEDGNRAPGLHSSITPIVAFNFI